MLLIIRKLAKALFTCSCLHIFSYDFYLDLLECIIFSLFSEEEEKSSKEKVEHLILIIRSMWFF